MSRQNPTRLPIKTARYGLFWSACLSMLWAFYSIGNAVADDRIPVALAYFENTSQDPALEPLKKGLVDMLITDLEVSKEIQLIERSRLNEILNEIDLQQSAFIDESSAVKIGKGLGAEYIVTGSYIVQSGFMRVDARMIDVENGKIVFAVKSEGNTSDWLSIERKLATELLEGLGATLTPIQKKRIGSSGTRNFNALSAYSVGLDALDAGDTAAASDALARAVAADPEFAAAQDLQTQINAIASSIDSTVSERRLDELYTFLAAEDCPCAYAKPLDTLKAASIGTRLAHRFFETAKNQAATASIAYRDMHVTALQLAEIGQFERAETLLNAMMSDDFMTAKATTLYFSPGTAGPIPLPSYTPPESLLNLMACQTYQVRSYVELLQLNFKEAMNWQLEAIENVSLGKEECLSEHGLLSLGLTLKHPLRREIQSAIDDPATFARWKHNRDQIQAQGPAAWERLQDRLQQSPVCNEVCPNAVVGAANHEQERARKAEEEARAKPAREAQKLVEFLVKHTTDVTGLPESCSRAIGCCNWLKSTTNTYVNCPELWQFEKRPYRDFAFACEGSWETTTEVGNATNVEWPKQCDYDAYIAEKTEREAQAVREAQAAVSNFIEGHFKKNLADGWPKVCAQALSCASWLTETVANNPEVLEEFATRLPQTFERLTNEMVQVRDKPVKLKSACELTLSFVERYARNSIYGFSRHESSLPPECEP